MTASVQYAKNNGLPSQKVYSQTSHTYNIKVAQAVVESKFCYSL